MSQWCGYLYDISVIGAQCTAALVIPATTIKHRYTSQLKHKSYVHTDTHLTGKFVSLREYGFIVLKKEGKKTTF